MAKQDVEQLILRLSADFRAYEKAFAKAQSTTSANLRKMEADTNSAMARMNKAISNSVRGIGAGVLGGLTFTGIAKGAQVAIKAIADIGDAAVKLGVTTDEYQELAFAAKLAGTETEAFASAMKKLGANSSDAARGQGDLAKVMEANGKSLTLANGQMKSQAEILGIVADLVKGAKSEQDALRIATMALGKSGSEMMGLLQQGATGVKSAMEEASRAGVKFSSEQIARAQTFDDAIDTLVETISVDLKTAMLDAATFGAQSFGQIETVVGRITGNVETLVSYLTKIRDLMPGAKVSQDNPLFSLRVGGKTLIGAKPGSNPGAGSDPNGFNSIGKPPAATSSGKATIIPSDGKSSSKKDVDAHRQAIEDQIRALIFQGQQLKRNDREQAIYNELQKNGVSATSEHGRQIARLAGANYDAAKAVETANKDYEEQNRLRKEAIALSIENQKAIRQGEVDRMASMNERSGGRGVSNAFEKIIDEGTNYAQMSENLVLDMYSGMEDAFVRFAQTGKMSFKDLTASVLEDLSRMTFKMAAAGFVKSLAGGGTGGGFLQSMFSGLPSFAVGTNYVPHDMTANIHRGEMIVPRKQADIIRAGGGGQSAPNITIINTTGQPVTAQTSRNSNGGYDVKLTMKEMIGGMIANGSFDNALGARFGSRALVGKRG